MVNNSCKKVITIPQYIGTCWFNTILMTILYSQYSRKLLLKNNTLDKKKDKISKILNQLLKHNYIKHKYAEEYFKYMRPEIILKYSNILGKNYKIIIENGYNSAIAIHLFIQLLNKTSLQIDVYDNKLYGNFNKILSYDLFYYNIHKLNEIKKEDFKQNPDYIIISPIPHANNYSISLYDSAFHSILLENDHIKKRLLIDNVKTSGIFTLEDKITYNGDTYILDSCILRNTNTSEFTGYGHVIAGLTCKNKKYVYNGWLRTTSTTDKIDNKILVKEKVLPCELMPFDWNINNSSFCLNAEKCKLDRIKKLDNTKLCYSFGSGSRVLIYVKVSINSPKIDIDKNFTSSSVLTLPSELLSNDPVENLNKIATFKSKLQINDKPIKKLANFELFKKKLDKSVLLYLINYNNNYYIKLNNIDEQLTLRNPDYIFIDNDNKYDILPIIYIAKIEYITKVSNYDISINIKRNYLYYNDYKYKLYATIKNINVYKLMTDDIKKMEKPLLKPISTDISTNKDDQFKKYNKMINEMIIKLKETNMKKDITHLKQSLKMVKKILKMKPMLKSDYISFIKKLYPYYANLNKYKLNELKKIYEFNCNKIKLNYNNNSCYIDSVLVALFNSKSPIITKIILNSPLIKYDKKLDIIGENIRRAMKSLYNKITLGIDVNNCSQLRKLLKQYYDRYKIKIDENYHDIEWIDSQNDFSELLIFLQLIFDFPLNVKYKLNNRIENRIFFDINNYIDISNTDITYIKDYYPKYTNEFELEDGTIRKEKIEILSAPLLFIQINRIFDFEKKDTQIIPTLKIKLKENYLYLNSIIIHYGYDMNSGHYICLYECKGIWYEFDDIVGENKKIGKFDKILNNDSYIRNIVGLVYIDNH